MLPNGCFQRAKDLPSAAARDQYGLGSDPQLRNFQTLKRKEHFAVNVGSTRAGLEQYLGGARPHEPSNGAAVNANRDSENSKRAANDPRL